MASLATLSEKFQMDGYRKAMVARGKASPATVEDVMLYDPEAGQMTCTLLKLSPEHAARVRPELRARGHGEFFLMTRTFNREIILWFEDSTRRRHCVVRRRLSLPRSLQSSRTAR